MTLYCYIHFVFFILYYYHVLLCQGREGLTLKKLHHGKTIIQ